MKSIPRLLSILVLLSASGIVSGIDRVTLPRLTSTTVPRSHPTAASVAASRAPAAGIGWRCVTPAPLGPASTAGRTGLAPVPGF